MHTKTQLNSFFLCFLLSLLYCRLFTWIQNQPTSDRWKLGIESFSFCKYQFAPSAVSVLHTCLKHPCCLSPTLNTCIKWSGQLDRHKMYAQLDSYIGPKLLTHLSTLFFFLHHIPSVNFVVSQNFLFFFHSFFTTIVLCCCVLQSSFVRELCRFTVKSGFLLMNENILNTMWATHTHPNKTFAWVLLVKDIKSKISLAKSKFTVILQVYIFCKHIYIFYV